MLDYSKYYQTIKIKEKLKIHNGILDGFHVV